MTTKGSPYHAAVARLMEGASPEARQAFFRLAVAHLWGYGLKPDPEAMEQLRHLEKEGRA